MRTNAWQKGFTIKSKTVLTDALEPPDCSLGNTKALIVTVYLKWSPLLSLEYWSRSENTVVVVKICRSWYPIAGDEEF